MMAIFSNNTHNRVKVSRNRPRWTKGFRVG